MIKKESLPDRPKFCRSGSAVRHLFWRLVPSHYLSQSWLLITVTSPRGQRIKNFRSRSYLAVPRVLFSDFLQLVPQICYWAVGFVHLLKPRNRFDIFIYNIPIFHSWNNQPWHIAGCHLHSSDAGDGTLRLWVSIPSLLMLWLLKSPELQQAWYWLCRTDNMYCCSKLNFIYMGQAKSEIWLQMWLYLL